MLIFVRADDKIKLVKNNKYLFGIIMIKIITDSSSNFTQEEAKKLGIIVMPLTFIFGNEQYLDGIDMDWDTFYNRMDEEKELPHTSQLTEEQIDSAIKQAKGEIGESDEVLIMPIAAVLSGTTDRCKTVAARYKNVYVYDTRCTTVVLKSLVLEALANADKPVAEVIEILDAYRPKLKIYAVLDTLENLRKGGRLSNVVAIIGNLLKIKPVITFTDDGKVDVISKQFGINKGISYITSKIDKNKIDFTKPVYLIYTKTDKNCELLRAKLNIEFSEKSNICPVIGVHNGSNAAGIVYAEK